MPELSYRPLTATLVRVQNPNDKNYDKPVMEVTVDSNGWDFTKKPFAVIDASYGYVNYWIDEFDSSNRKMTIYIQVPDVGAYETVSLYILGWRGTMNQGTLGIFSLYDNFDTWTGWNQYNYGSVVYGTTTYYSPPGALNKIYDCDPNGGYKLLSYSLDRDTCDIICSFKGYRGDGAGTTCYADRHGVENSSYDGYSWNLGHTTSGTAQLSVDVRTSGTATVEGAVLCTGNLTSIWYTGTMAVGIGTVYVLVYNSDGSLNQKTSYAHSTYTTFDRYVIHGGRPYYVDNLRVFPSIWGAKISIIKDVVVRWSRCLN